MFVRKRIIKTKLRPHRHRRSYGLTVKDVVKFLSSLILPLMLDVFTVVITCQQQKEARQQRLEDKQQRELDLNISQIQEMAQIKAAANRYRDEVFVAYIKEMGDFLEKKNGTLTSDPLIHTLARVKTLNAIRQLDGTRQIHILRFLYEAGQLTNTNQFIALDISTAELTDIDFRKSGQLLDTGEISLAGVYLVNSTFSDMPLINVKFSSVWFYDVNFSSAGLYNVKFSSAYGSTMSTFHLLCSAMSTFHLLGLAMSTFHLLRSTMSTFHLLCSTMSTFHLLGSAMSTFHLLASIMLIKCTFLR
jgi:uncharacterized protein YjbI with pentapeptide repeats